MFDHVKVNQNSIMNLIKVSGKDNSDNLPGKPVNDFFTMVMEKTAYEDKRNKVESRTDQSSGPMEIRSQNEYSRTDRKIEISDSEVKQSEVKKEKKDPELKTTDKENIDKNKSLKNEASDEVEEKSESGESVVKSEEPAKDIQTAKNSDEESDKESDDELDVADQLGDEKNIKTLLDLIKAAFNGNVKDEEENLQKLSDNLKFKKDKDKEKEKDKDITSSKFFSKPNEADKNQKGISVNLNNFMKDLKELINREVSKGFENKKSSGKPQPLNNKELKELALNIIEGIKKNKAKDIVKHEVKVLSGEEVKSDKKIPVVTVEDQSSKKIILSDEASSDKSGSKEKNSSRDNFSYNGNKFELSTRSGVDRVEQTRNMADFKENLQEIIDKAKVSVKDSRNGTFTVRLNPQELGNVNVNLVMENGVITGKFLVDNEDVKSMLLNSLNDLKSQMEEAGIAVGEFTVNVDDQREKYLKQKDEEELRSMFSFSKDKEVIAAAEQYDSNSAVHTGHINMVI